MLVNFSKNPIIYVTRDLERALGLPLETKGYFIISNYSAFAKKRIGARKNVFLVKGKGVLDTRELLDLPQVKKFINKIKKPNIVVFKNTIQIEEICQKNGWKLLNPPAKLSNMIEEKISQIEWLGELAKFLPPYRIMECGQIKWLGKKFVLQFNRAHTGSGTVLIESEQQLKEIQDKFVKRPVRVMEYISGPVLTNNNVVWGKKVLIGNISYQITGLKPFTDRPFATVGNDWALPYKILTRKQLKEYNQIAQAIGKRMAQSGWQGLFGIDVIWEEKTGKLYLIEINARQPASATFESILQREKDKSGLTIFKAHLLALLGGKYNREKLVVIKNGAQIVQKVVPIEKSIDEKLLDYNVRKFKKDGWDIFLYNNTELEKDWIRMQSSIGIMEAHNKINHQGTKATLFVSKLFF